MQRGGLRHKEAQWPRWEKGTRLAKLLAPRDEQNMVSKLVRKSSMGQMKGPCQPYSALLCWDVWPAK